MTIFQINIFLLCLISAMAIFHRGPGRSSAFIYAVIMVAQAIVSDYFEGYQYFIICGVFATALLFALSSFPVGSTLADILFGISCISWGLNLAGGISWHYELSLDNFYYTWTFLYLAAATTMLWEDGHHDRGNGPVFNFLRIISYPGFVLRRAIHGEAKT